MWEMKEDKYAKSLAKNQVYAIVYMRDIRENVLPNFIKLCMETPCLSPGQYKTRTADCGQRTADWCDDRVLPFQQRIGELSVKRTRETSA